MINLPWKVMFRRRLNGWHEKSLPCVVDSTGSVVFEPLQFVSHPGDLDIRALALCLFCVRSANLMDPETVRDFEIELKRSSV